MVKQDTRNETLYCQSNGERDCIGNMKIGRKFNLYSISCINSMRQLTHYKFNMQVALGQLKHAT